MRTSFLPGLALWSLFPRPQSHGPTFWTVFYGKRLVNSVSLTTPAVVKSFFDFFFCLSLNSRTLPRRRTNCASFFRCCSSPSP